jgi:hypothetical protein
MALPHSRHTRRGMHIGRVRGSATAPVSWHSTRMQGLECWNKHSGMGCVVRVHRIDRFRISQCFHRTGEGRNLRPWWLGVRVGALHCVYFGSVQSHIWQVLEHGGKWLSCCGAGRADHGAGHGTMRWTHKTWCRSFTCLISVMVHCRWGRSGQRCDYRWVWCRLVAPGCTWAGCIDGTYQGASIG